MIGEDLDLAAASSPPFAGWAGVNRDLRQRDLPSQA
jgi:hypothetical protein